LPKNRKPTETILVKEAKRLWVYELISQRLAENRQIYFVYPVIEETEEEDMHSLEVMSEEIKKQFKPALCGVFHGKMKVKDKIAVIEEFRNNKIQILIATTVVEVGVSIPNATTMVVESPHRFGLAQLHQLRGRIRRSDYDSYFIMLSKDNLSPVAKSRLKTIASTSDGFKIAEEDLLLRGPGDFFGTSQHGCPQLKIANPLRDLEILKQARAFAYQVIKNDPELIKKENLCIKNHFSFWLER
ncbi:MAG: helicase-related protein, partial [Candidatus Omnitrophica bacterium]|nr:helicase-related protein [Candidatus Omnitrophota bacterium]